MLGELLDRIPLNRWTDWLSLYWWCLRYQETRNVVR